MLQLLCHRDIVQVLQNFQDTAVFKTILKKTFISTSKSEYMLS